MNIENIINCPKFFLIQLRMSLSLHYLYQDSLLWEDNTGSTSTVLQTGDVIRHNYLVLGVSVKTKTGYTSRNSFVCIHKNLSIGDGHPQ